MPLPSDKVMFEIYREADYGRRYRVVYFTELGEKNKESEINRAMAGEHVFDGFLIGARIAEAKRVIEEWLGRRNGGESAETAELEAALGAYLVP